MLLQQARTKRDKAIQAAKRQYRIESQELRGMKRRLKLVGRGRPRQLAYDRQIAGGNNSCLGMTVTAAVHLILSEGKPLTLVELTIEVQRRGVRVHDDSRFVAKTVHGALCNYRERYKRDDKGRWAVAGAFDAPREPYQQQPLGRREVSGD